MSPDRLPRHRFRPTRLTAAVAFAVVGAVAVTDSSFDRGLGWLWGAALVMLGVAGAVASFDRLRATNEVLPDEA